MKKDKAFKFRLFITFVVFIADFFIFPFLIAKILGQVNQESMITGIKLLFMPKVLDIWKWLQPMAVAFLVFVWFAGRSLVNISYRDDITPERAGHGQHGTSRWLTEKEVDKHFSVHFLKKQDTGRRDKFARRHSNRG